MASDLIKKMAGANHAFGWLYTDSLRVRHRVELAGAVIPKGWRVGRKHGPWAVKIWQYLKIGYIPNEIAI